MGGCQDESCHHGLDLNGTLRPMAPTAVGLASEAALHDLATTFLFAFIRVHSWSSFVPIRGRYSRPFAVARPKSIDTRSIV